ncbi:MAG3090 family protein [Mycoplasmopsis columbinasalis]|uniref:Uncharacterized protein n=1 Tax=Mycoplasmopsis columbinasalis TaxID=114880 RepID=A0A449B9G6_9BACT|nr:hypothetical protein [Mycoplasmopsis columbinasalis]VEU77803.1 Uncharacterised protein [Mycoplasmopsis columbinasalis]
MKRLNCTFEWKSDPVFPWLLKHPKIDHGLAKFHTREDALKWFMNLKIDTAVWFHDINKAFAIFGGKLIIDEVDGKWKNEITTKRFDGQYTPREIQYELGINPQTKEVDPVELENYVQNIEFILLDDPSKYFDLANEVEFSKYNKKPKRPSQVITTYQIKEDIVIHIIGPDQEPSDFTASQLHSQLTNKEVIKEDLVETQTEKPTEVVQVSPHTDDQETKQILEEVVPTSAVPVESDSPIPIEQTLDEFVNEVLHSPSDENAEELFDAKIKEDLIQNSLDFTEINQVYLDTKAPLVNQLNNKNVIKEELADGDVKAESKPDKQAIPQAETATTTPTFLLVKEDLVAVNQPNYNQPTNPVNFNLIKEEWPFGKPEAPLKEDQAHAAQPLEVVEETPAEFVPVKEDLVTHFTPHYPADGEPVDFNLIKEELPGGKAYLPAPKEEKVELVAQPVVETTKLFVPVKEDLVTSFVPVYSLSPSPVNFNLIKEEWPFGKPEAPLKEDQAHAAQSLEVVEETPAEFVPVKEDLVTHFTPQYPADGEPLDFNLIKEEWPDGKAYLPAPKEEKVEPTAQPVVETTKPFVPVKEDFITSFVPVYPLSPSPVNFNLIKEEWPFGKPEAPLKEDQAHAAQSLEVVEETPAEFVPVKEDLVTHFTPQYPADGEPLDFNLIKEEWPGGKAYLPAPKEEKVEPVAQPVVETAKPFVPVKEDFVTSFVPVYPLSPSPVNFNLIKEEWPFGKPEAPLKEDRAHAAQSLEVVEETPAEFVPVKEDLVTHFTPQYPADGEPVDFNLIKEEWPDGKAYLPAPKEEKVEPTAQPVVETTKPFVPVKEDFITSFVPVYPLSPSPVNFNLIKEEWPFGKPEVPLKEDQAHAAQSLEVVEETPAEFVPVKEDLVTHFTPQYPADGEPVDFNLIKEEWPDGKAYLPAPKEEKVEPVAQPVVETTKPFVPVKEDFVTSFVPVYPLSPSPVNFNLIKEEWPFGKPEAPLKQDQAHAAQPLEVEEAPAEFVPVKEDLVTNFVPHYPADGEPLDFNLIKEEWPGGKAYLPVQKEEKVEPVAQPVVETTKPFVPVKEDLVQSFTPTYSAPIFVNRNLIKEEMPDGVARIIAKEEPKPLQEDKPFVPVKEDLVQVTYDFQAAPQEFQDNRWPIPELLEEGLLIKEEMPPFGDNFEQSLPKEQSESASEVEPVAEPLPTPEETQPTKSFVPVKEDLVEATEPNYNQPTNPVNFNLIKEEWPFGKPEAPLKEDQAHAVQPLVVEEAPAEFVPVKEDLVTHFTPQYPADDEPVDFNLIKEEWPGGKAYSPVQKEEKVEPVVQPVVETAKPFVPVKEDFVTSFVPVYPLSPSPVNFNLIKEEWPFGKPEAPLKEDQAHAAQPLEVEEAPAEFVPVKEDLVTNFVPHYPADFSPVNFDLIKEEWPDGQKPLVNLPDSPKHQQFVPVKEDFVSSFGPHYPASKSPVDFNLIKEEWPDGKTYLPVSKEEKVQPTVQPAVIETIKPFVPVKEDLVTNFIPHYPADFSPVNFDLIKEEWPDGQKPLVNLPDSPKHQQFVPVKEDFVNSFGPHYPASKSPVDFELIKEEWPDGVAYLPAKEEMQPESVTTQTDNSTEKLTVEEEKPFVPVKEDLVETYVPHYSADFSPVDFALIKEEWPDGEKPFISPEQTPVHKQFVPVKEDFVSSFVPHYPPSKSPVDFELIKEEWPGDVYLPEASEPDAVPAPVDSTPLVEEENLETQQTFVDGPPIKEELPTRKTIADWTARPQEFRDDLFPIAQSYANKVLIKEDDDEVRLFMASGGWLDWTTQKDPIDNLDVANLRELKGYLDKEKAYDQRYVTKYKYIGDFSEIHQYMIVEQYLDKLKALNDLVSGQTISDSDFSRIYSNVTAANWVLDNINAKLDATTLAQSNTQLVEPLTKIQDTLLRKFAYGKGLSDKPINSAYYYNTVEKTRQLVAYETSYLNYGDFYVGFVPYAEYDYEIPLVLKYNVQNPYANDQLLANFRSLNNAVYTGLENYYKHTHEIDKNEVNIMKHANLTPQLDPDFTTKEDQVEYTIIDPDDVNEARSQYEENKIKEDQIIFPDLRVPVNTQPIAPEVIDPETPGQLNYKDAHKAKRQELKNAAKAKKTKEKSAKVPAPFAELIAENVIPTVLPANEVKEPAAKTKKAEPVVDTSTIPVVAQKLPDFWTSQHEDFSKLHVTNEKADVTVAKGEKASTGFKIFLAFAALFVVAVIVLAVFGILALTDVFNIFS